LMMTLILVWISPLRLVETIHTKCLKAKSSLTANILIGAAEKHSQCE
jgi:hypothetical protein